MHKLQSITAFSLMLVSLPLICNAELSTADIATQVKPAVMTVVVYDAKDKKSGQGTGFLVEPDKVITSFHVVKDAAKIKVKDYQANMHLVKGVTYLDELADIAVLSLSVPILGVSTVQLSPTVPRDGDKVIVIGGPMGLEYTVSEGIVSAVREFPGVVRLLQISAPISPGSSGSPVLDMSGKAIGLVMGFMPQGQNLNFAIHISAVQNLLRNDSGVSSSTDSENSINEDSNQLLQKAVALLPADTLSPDAPKNYEAALSLAEQVSQKDTTCWSAHSLAGYCLLQLKRNNEALTHLEQAVSSSDANAYAYYYLGQAHRACGEEKFDIKHVNGAINAFRKAIELQPDMPEAYYLLGVTLFFNAKDDTQRKEAIDCLRTVIKLSPGVPAGHTLLGKALLGSPLFDVEGAKAECLEAVRIAPDLAMAHCGLGDVYSVMGTSAWIKNMPQNPDFAEPLRDKESDGLFYKAEECYKEAIRLDPNYVDAHRGLGSVYIYLNRNDESAECYREVLRLNPNDADAHEQLGMYYVLIAKDRSHALDEYRILKELDQRKADDLFRWIYPNN